MKKLMMFGAAFVMTVSMGMTAFAEEAVIAPVTVQTATQGTGCVFVDANGDGICDNRTNSCTGYVDAICPNQDHTNCQGQNQGNCPNNTSQSTQSQSSTSSNSESDHSSGGHHSGGHGKHHK